MIFRRSKRATTTAQLDAALADLPVGGITVETESLASYARLLAPKSDLTPGDVAGLERFISEALVARGGGVDLEATSETDEVTSVHVREVQLEDGTTVRMADVERLSDQAVAEVTTQVTNEGTAAT